MQAKILNIYCVKHFLKQFDIGPSQYLQGKYTVQTSAKSRYKGQTK